MRYLIYSLLAVSAFLLLQAGIQHGAQSVAGGTIGAILKHALQ